MSKNEKLPDNIKPEMIGEMRYVRINEGAKRYSVSPNTFRMMAPEAHAIIHIKSYLLARLFNAGSTISSYYRAEVNHDMPQFVG